MAFFSVSALILKDRHTCSGIYIGHPYSSTLSPTSVPLNSVNAHFLLRALNKHCHKRSERLAGCEVVWLLRIGFCICLLLFSYKAADPQWTAEALKCISTHHPTVTISPSFKTELNCVLQLVSVLHPHLSRRFHFLLLCVHMFVCSGVCMCVSAILDVFL